MKNRFPRLTLITHQKDCLQSSYLTFIERAVDAGVSCVQLRAKGLPFQELYSFGKALKNLLDVTDTPLIINDHVDLCLELDAAGVHLGQTDTNPFDARAALGADKIIGLTVDSLLQVEASSQFPIDYLGIGAIFPTISKQDVKTIWGLSALKQALLKTSYPLIAVGGIDATNVRSVLDAGAHGIAAIGAFHQGQDPFFLTRDLVLLMQEVQGDR
ncbi:MAG: thiamine phosphate synthase [Candidatus Rhabdochlamydia sp.]